MADVKSIPTAELVKQYREAQASTEDWVNNSPAYQLVSARGELVRARDGQREALDDLDEAQEHLAEANERLRQAEATLGALLDGGGTNEGSGDSQV